MKGHAIAEKYADARDLLICIHLGADASEAAAAVEYVGTWLEIFHRRFSARVVLGMAGFSSVPPSTLATWIGKDLLALSICSGHDELTLTDFVHAAIRLRAQQVCFIDAKHLLFDMAGTIRFLLEGIRNADRLSLERDGHALFVPVSELQQLPWLELDRTWPSRLRRMYRWCRHGVMGDRSTETLHLASHESGNLSTRPRHCFATVAGVRRAGGFAKFLTMPLRMGGIPVAAFDHYWLLDVTATDLRTPPGNDAGTTCSQKHVPAIWSTEGAKASVVFDVCPAPHTAVDVAEINLGECIDVPRQLVIGRKFQPLVSGRTTRGDQEAVFIASNYNKERYLYASLYSLIMQSHPHVRVEVVDDVSSDKSVMRVHHFRTLLGLPDDMITLRKNLHNRGTYWIRNDVTARNSKSDIVLFVNDSDDYSSSLRATLQIAMLQTNNKLLGCFFDIVRVGPTYAPLIVGSEVERYGTASLCYTSELIRRVGYFQNIKKNADTEFIERVKHFEGRDALPWFRYPVLFQPFDGSNLTADIYAIHKVDSRIDVRSGVRSLHSTIFRRHHRQLKREELASQFAFPLSTITEDYAVLGDEFLIDGYRAEDKFIILLTSSRELAEADAWLTSAICVLFCDSDQHWVFLAPCRQNPISGPALAEVLRTGAQQHAPHAYLVSGALLSAPHHAGVQGSRAVLAHLSSTWLQRSKAEGDRWAYTGNGERLAPTMALAALSKQWHLMEGEDSFDKTPVFMHTTSFLSDIRRHNRLDPRTLDL